MRRIVSLRPPQGVVGVVLLAVGVWRVFDWGWALVVIGAFLLLAELLRST